MVSVPDASEYASYFGRYISQVEGNDLFAALTSGMENTLALLAPLTETQALHRYAARIQLQRQDFNGRYLTIRRDDLRILAAVFGHGSEEFGARLEALGLRAQV